MSRKKKSTTKRTPPARILDADELFERLENHFTDDGDPYHKIYTKVRAEELALYRADGAEQMAKLLDVTEVGALVETATRKAGFVLGFEMCRQLLMGELDRKAPRGGGR